jgi:hypothetical protein
VKEGGAAGPLFTLSYSLIALIVGPCLLRPPLPFQRFTPPLLFSPHLFNLFFFHSIVAII